jgi:hypothetical protein
VYINKEVHGLVGILIVKLKERDVHRRGGVLLSSSTASLSSLYDAFHPEWKVPESERAQPEGTFHIAIPLFSKALSHRASRLELLSL